MTRTCSCKPMPHAHMVRGMAYENPMSQGQKQTAMIGAVILGIGAIGLAFYEAGKKPKAPVTGGAPPSDGGGAPTISPGTWVPATTLHKNKVYRASSDVRGFLQSNGFKLYVDHDTVPLDWPKDDTDPNRWRLEGVWNFPDQPVQSWISSVGAKFYEWVPAVSSVGKMSPAHWEPATVLSKGKTYRASANARSVLTQYGIQVWTDYNTMPADWPDGDDDPNRFRVEGTWPSADVLLSALSQYGDAKIWEFVP